MKEVTRNLLVGAFVISALTVLGTLMVWFGEVPDWIATSEWTLRIAGVRELSGIGDGAPVNLQGVQIGRVKTIEFRNPEDPEQGVVIVTRIKQQYTVPQGSEARVYGSTLGLGSGRIDIMLKPGASGAPLPKDDAVIGGSMRSVLGEIIKEEFVDSLEETVTHIGGLAEAARPVMENLSDLLERRPVDQVGQPGAKAGMVANLTTLVERLDLLVANVNTVFGDENVQGDIKLAVRDLTDTARDLKETVALWRTESKRLADNVNNGVDRTTANLEDTFQLFRRVLTELDGAATNLSRVTRALTEASGSAGLLVHDPRLYESAVLAADRLAAVLLDIKSLTGQMREDGYITVGLAPNGFPKKQIPLSTADVETDGTKGGSERVGASDRAVRESREPATLGSFPP